MLKGNRFISQVYCRGFIRIRKVFQEYLEVIHEKQEIGGGVKLNFAQIMACKPEALGPDVQRNQEKILDLLRESPTLTTREVAQRKFISRRAIEKQLDKHNFTVNLHCVAPDKGGYWQVLGVF